MNDDMFARNVPGMTERLQGAVVAVAGCGGLGSNAAVALARAGVGTLILADYDTVEPSNLNRQFFFRGDLGRTKTRALAAHLRNINPDISLHLYQVRLTPDQVDPLLGRADLLIEAFDRAEEKQWLIETWCTLFPEKPVIAASGLAGVGGTGALRVQQSGALYICGDGVSDPETEGLCSARVALTANMQANIALALLCGKQHI
ncbi:sulfur carrier protein ThiS adenylyltransferase ThiF [bacterium]|nr:sulfur carrier protein ThiS adenylyltransferase ThiF [bacterium]